MRRALLSIVFGISLASAFGQIASDIAPGMAAEQVMHSYGWPKGKSVAAGRESWLYDRFQVRFENGKVVSVSYISPTSPGTTKASPMNNPHVTDKTSPAAPRPGLPSALISRPPSPAPSPSGNLRPLPGSEHAVHPRAALPPPTPIVSSDVMWGVAFTALLSLGVAVFVPVLTRKRNATAPSDPAPETQPADSTA